MKERKEPVLFGSQMILTGVENEAHDNKQKHGATDADRASREQLDAVSDEKEHTQETETVPTSIKIESESIDGIEASEESDGRQDIEESEQISEGELSEDGEGSVNGEYDDHNFDAMLETSP